MSSENVAVEVDSLCKCYQLYNAPADRLKQALMPRLQRFAGIPAKSYFREFWALRNVSFQALQGETVGIIGRNGSGKSTLLQIITGTLMPTSGRVVANGRVAALLELGAGFNPEFSGRENVYLNAALLGLSREETDARFEEISDFAGIGDFLEAPVKTYSSGMYVRLAFAVAACVDPDILIIDEALSVGDAAFQFKCLKRIEALQAKGVTLLFVSHDMHTVQRFCQRVIYLEQGEVKSIGDPESIAAQYFFDTREMQRQSLHDMPSYQKEIALGDSTHSMAFGNGHVSILSARFMPDGRTHEVLAAGVPIEFEVEVDYQADEDEVALAVSVENTRLISLTGKFFALPSSRVRARRSFQIRLPNHFNTDHYLITIRLTKRVGANQYLPFQSQLAALHFQVSSIPGEYPVPGYFLTDMTLTEKEGASPVASDSAVPASAALLRQGGRPRIVALLAVRNEAAYLERCLHHLAGQGIETYLIDNESTDATLEIAQRWYGKGIIGIETLTYPGHFDLHSQLARKTVLSTQIDADWFIHHDADEIRQSRNPQETLAGAIARLDAAGWNAIEFDEFVFVPVTEDGTGPGGDYVEKLHHAYYFLPRPQFRVNAWKNGCGTIDLLATAGHEVRFAARNLSSEALILRHYPFLSRQHLIDKYTQQRIYSRHETDVLGWHGRRATFNPDDIRMPAITELLEPDRHGWDTSRPLKSHPFFSK
jgi:lipopolysaccharide transport system ATP-binding protein